MNYGDLKSLVASYLHRSDLTARMPTFIEHGRILFCNTLRVPECETSATVTLTAGIGALSSDVIAVRAVLGPNRPLRQADLESVSQVTSESVYAITGLNIWAPGCGTVTVYYWERPLTLVGAADATTRTVLSIYPNIWLYAALVSGYRFLDDAENESRMQMRLDEEIRLCNARADRYMTVSAPAMSDRNVNSIAQGPGL